MSKMKELMGIGTEELEAKLLELRKELMKLNSQIATGTTPKNPGKLKQTKKTIARIIMLIENKRKAVQKEKIKTVDTKNKNPKKHKEGLKKDG